MKRNQLIAIAVGAVMSAALSSAYADPPLAPTPGNQQANQGAAGASGNTGVSVNPAPFAQNGDQQQSGQPDQQRQDLRRDRRDSDDSGRDK